jgi:uncharacterized membrane protein
MPDTAAREDDIDAAFRTSQPVRRDTAELPELSERPRRRTRARRTSYSFLAPVCVVAAIALTVVALTYNLMTLASSFTALVAVAFVLAWVWLYSFKHYIAYTVALVLALVASGLFYEFRHYVGIYTLGSVAVYLGLAVLIVVSGKRKSASQG